MLTTTAVSAPAGAAAPPGLVPMPATRKVTVADLCRWSASGPDACWRRARSLASEACPRTEHLTTVSCTPAGTEAGLALAVSTTTCRSGFRSV